MTLPWIAIALAIGANVAANMALTFGARGGTERGGGGNFVSLFERPWTWAGLLAAALLLFAYLYAIKHLPVGIVYAMVTCLSMILVTACSAMLLGERPSPLTLIAMTLIISGVGLMATEQVR